MTGSLSFTGLFTIPTAFIGLGDVVLLQNEYTIWINCDMSNIQNTFRLTPKTDFNLSQFNLNELSAIEQIVKPLLNKAMTLPPNEKACLVSKEDLQIHTTLSEEEMSKAIFSFNTLFDPKSELGFYSYDRFQANQPMVLLIRKVYPRLKRRIAKLKEEMKDQERFTYVYENGELIRNSDNRVCLKVIEKRDGETTKTFKLMKELVNTGSVGSSFLKNTYRGLSDNKIRDNLKDLNTRFRKRSEMERDLFIFKNNQLIVNFAFEVKSTR